MKRGRKAAGMGKGQVARTKKKDTVQLPLSFQDAPVATKQWALQAAANLKLTRGSRSSKQVAVGVDRPRPRLPTAPSQTPAQHQHLQPQPDTDAIPAPVDLPDSNAAPEKGVAGLAVQPSKEQPNVSWRERLAAVMRNTFGIETAEHATGLQTQSPANTPKPLSQPLHVPVTVYIPEHAAHAQKQETLAIVHHLRHPALRSGWQPKRFSVQDQADKRGSPPFASLPQIRTTATHLSSIPPDSPPEPQAYQQRQQHQVLPCMPSFPAQPKQHSTASAPYTQPHASNTAEWWQLEPLPTAMNASTQHPYNRPAHAASGAVPYSPATSPCHSDEPISSADLNGNDNLVMHSMSASWVQRGSIQRRHHQLLRPLLKAAPMLDSSPQQRADYPFGSLNMAQLLKVATHKHSQHHHDIQHTSSSSSFSSDADHGGNGCLERDECDHIIVQEQHRAQQRWGALHSNATQLVDHQHSRPGKHTVWLADDDDDDTGDIENDDDGGGGGGQQHTVWDVMPLLDTRHGERPLLVDTGLQRQQHGASGLLLDGDLSSHLGVPGLAHESPYMQSMHDQFPLGNNPCMAHHPSGLLHCQLVDATIVNSPIALLPVHPDHRPDHHPDHHHGHHDDEWPGGCGPPVWGGHDMRTTSSAWLEGSLDGNLPPDDDLGVDDDDTNCCERKGGLGTATIMTGGDDCGGGGGGGDSGGWFQSRGGPQRIMQGDVQLARGASGSWRLEQRQWVVPEASHVISQLPGLLG